MELVAVAALVVLGAFGTLLMKIGAGGVVYDRGAWVLVHSVITNLPLLAGIGIQLVPLAGWTVLLKTMPLTKLQPMIALTYVVTPLLAYLFLNESLTSLRLLGIAFIVVGVMLVAGS